MKKTRYQFVLCILVMILNAGCSTLDEMNLPKPECAKTSFSVKNLKLICSLNPEHPISWVANIQNSGNRKAVPYITTFLSKTETMNDSSLLLGTMQNASAVEGKSENFDVKFSCDSNCNNRSISLNDYKYLIVQIENTSSDITCKESRFVFTAEIPDKFQKSCEAKCSNPDLSIVSSKLVCRDDVNDIAWEYEIINQGEQTANGHVNIWLSKNEMIDRSYDILIENQALLAMEKHEKIQVSGGGKLGLDLALEKYKFVLFEVILDHQIEECNTQDNSQSVTIQDGYFEKSCPAASGVDCSSLSFTQLKNQMEWLNKMPIVISTSQGVLLNSGSVLFVETNEQRLGILEIVSVHENLNYQTDVKAIIYNSDGSIYKQKDSVTVKSMKFFDLDELRETNEMQKADFLWKKISTLETSLIPRNKSRYKVCVAK